jgi:hypothetical protein
MNVLAFNLRLNELDRLPIEILNYILNYILLTEKYLFSKTNKNINSRINKRLKNTYGIPKNRKHKLDRNLINGVIINRVPKGPDLYGSTNYRKYNCNIATCVTVHNCNDCSEFKGFHLTHFKYDFIKDDWVEFKTFSIIETGVMDTNCGICKKWFPVCGLCFKRVSIICNKCESNKIK